MFCASRHIQNSRRSPCSSTKLPQASCTGVQRQMEAFGVLHSAQNPPSDTTSVRHPLRATRACHRQVSGQCRGSRPTSAALRRSRSHIDEPDVSMFVSFVACGSFVDLLFCLLERQRLREKERREMERESDGDIESGIFFLDGDDEDFRTFADKSEVTPCMLFLVCCSKHMFMWLCSSHQTDLPTSRRPLRLEG